MSTFYRDDTYDILSDHIQRIRDLEQGCPPFIEPLPGQFENGWNHAIFTDPQWDYWGYRICDGELEFKGHLMPGTLGASAYTLPENFRIYNGNPSWISHMVLGDVFIVVHIKVDKTTGKIYVFPNAG